MNLKRKELLEGHPASARK